MTRNPPMTLHMPHQVRSEKSQSYARTYLPLTPRPTCFTSGISPYCSTHSRCVRKSNVGRDLPVFWKESIISFLKEAFLIAHSSGVRRGVDAQPAGRTPGGGEKRRLMCFSCLKSKSWGTVNLVAAWQSARFCTHSSNLVWP
jgi:hypothetical protein